MTIGSICNREVVIAERNMAVSDVAALMRDFHVGDVVVVDDLNGRRKPLGIVTDRDIAIEVVAMKVDPDGLKAADLMTRELVSVRESEGVFETIRHMRQKGVRRVPVVDDFGWLVGVVAMDDLLELLAEEIGELARLVNQEVGIERQTRQAVG